MIDIIAIELELDSDQHRTFRDAVSRFAELIAHKPYELPCKVYWADGIAFHLTQGTLAQKSFLGFATCVFEETAERISHHAEPSLRRIVVGCPPDHRVARMARSEWPDAEWGLSNGAISVIYHFEKALIWHEMFHLLGAEDCYDEKSPDASATPRCGDLRCIMQYAPNAERTGNPPFLCDANVASVTERYHELMKLTRELV